MENLLIPRRSREDRKKNHIIAINRMIQEYIKNGSKGNLDLSRLPIEKLPDNLIKVDGYLNLVGSKIKDLNNLKEVNGYLWAFGGMVRKLPNNLIVTGRLDLDGTKISKLPIGLKIGRNLTIRRTQIKELPSDLKVDGIVYIQDTPLSENQELVEQYKQKYSINLYE